MSKPMDYIDNEEFFMLLQDPGKAITDVIMPADQMEYLSQQFKAERDWAN